MTPLRQTRKIAVVGVELGADIVVPEAARGVVLFAHGSGSSRHSPRNRYVADQLQKAGLATVLTDLLTPAEERLDVQTRELRFDIELLTARVVKLTDWLSEQKFAAALDIGLFGASTGAAAALLAAATRPASVAAVVSRGGRPDLAAECLHVVRPPTLLIVGGRDQVGIEVNQQAMELLGSLKSMVIVPGASHLFAERGALEQVAQLTRDWFLAHLGPDRTTVTPGRTQP